MPQLYAFGIGLELGRAFLRLTLDNPAAPRASLTLERDGTYRRGDRQWQAWRTGRNAAGLYVGQVAVSAYRYG
jgi:hypothetical protein